MWQMTTDYPSMRQSKHVYVGETRIATRCNIEGERDVGYEELNTYYYHGDHLGSAQMVTSSEGEVYEHMEYTPYGELWIEATSESTSKTPFRFTGKELDEETGLYYYGARYMDPKTSRWISGDPAIESYLPVAPTSDEARRQNQNLPGMGGVFNSVNLAVYHYAGNNPIVCVDPTGSIMIGIPSLYKMNEGIWRADPTGDNIGHKSLYETGCAVTTMSNILSAALSSFITPREINNKKSNFVAKSDRLNMQKVGEDKGLTFDYWTSAHTNLLKKIKELEGSSSEFYVAAEVKYNSKGDTHWIGISGVVEIGGKEYLEIAASSTNDDDKASRPRSSWKAANDRMYIEVSDVNKIYTFEKETK